MIIGQSIIQLFKNSIVMVLLLGCSVAALALIIERIWFFTRNRFNTSKSLNQIRMIYKDTGVGPAIGYAQSMKNPLGRLFTLILENKNLNLDEVSDLSYGLILDERVKSERFLGGLGTLANVATLLGLLGTVTGLIRAFNSISVTGSGGPVVVSAGIAEALLTTAFGLFIGIPSLLFYNYFVKKSNDIAMTLESAQEKFIVLIESSKEPTREMKTRESRTSRKAVTNEVVAKEKVKEEGTWRY